MSDRDLSPFFAPKSIAVVGAGERATSSGGAIMQMLRQAGYGGRVVPVNPKGGTIFGYELVTSIAAIDPPVDLAVIVIRPDAILDYVVPFMVDASPVIARLATLAAGSRTPLLHSYPARPNGSPSWSAPACQCSMTLKKWPRPPACSRAIRVCASVPAVTTCPTCDSATVVALKPHPI